MRDNGSGAEGSVQRAFSSGERRQAEAAEEREARLSKRRTIDRARRQALSTKQIVQRNVCSCFGEAHDN